MHDDETGSMVTISCVSLPLSRSWNIRPEKPSYMHLTDPQI